MPFPCTKCGACCREIGLIVDLALNDEMEDVQIAGVEFEQNHYINPDGSCEHLLPDNSCSIYEERPRLCRIDVMIPLIGATEEEGYKLQAIACNRLILEQGLDAKFKILL